MAGAPDTAAFAEPGEAPSGAGGWRRLAVGVIRAWIDVCLRTTRWQTDLHPDAFDILTGRTGQGGVVAFWHEALALTPALRQWAYRINPTLRVHVLISRNRDGRLMSDIVRPWRTQVIAGSSTRRGKDKGGAQAFRRAVQAVRAAEVVVITPDGPSGPPHIAHPGATRIARAGNVPIVAIGASCTALRLPSWDRMLLPLPFGRGRIVCGAPLPPDVDDATLAAALNTQRKRARPRPVALVERVWGVAGRLLAPALVVLVHRRIARGKEIAGRRRERMGIADQPRPAGRLIWFHAASVGETLSLLPVVRALLQGDDAAAPHVLMTTATVTAASLVAREAQARDGRLIHQFVPFDVPRWVSRFLRHWRPDRAVFVESELWPSMLRALRARGIPVVLLNGRMSARSWRWWRRVPGLSRIVLGGFDWISARSAEDARRLRALGATRIEERGDLKQAAPPLGVDARALEMVREAIGGRPLWLAAATHEGEETIVADAARRLRERWPDLLTIIAPRHPGRGPAIAAALADGGRVPPRRATGGLPRAEDVLWIADTLGEMGLFYRLADIVFLGNSLPPATGGHNPFEPAQLGCAVAVGPETGNFNEAYARLGDDVARVQDSVSLARWVGAMLDDPDEVARRAHDSHARVSAAGDIVHLFATRLRSF
ncbi:DUF374 domain-containing protein [Ameyamaea chiangmaiensis]|nr:glycosyltransferase N-terminal domain-containing protein [Ameyamaea chiangmaiensis]MBS4075245.1 DUF374 domain-containing protein [Ameyamaea chiangmaiensis]